MMEVNIMNSEQTATHAARSSSLETENIFNLLSLTADPGVVSSLLTWSHNFFAI